MGVSGLRPPGAHVPPRDGPHSTGRSPPTCTLCVSRWLHRAAAASYRRARRRARGAAASASGGAGGGTFPALPPGPGDDEIVGWTWAGSDAFTPLGDRRDAPPLPLPRLRSAKRAVLVRHGQSTWNARNRIQGSSNFSVLTELGESQAAEAQRLLADWDFQCMFVSPLQRAAQTADIVWGTRAEPTFTLPCLREIDLYSFQGLDKIESRTLYGEQYQNWQTAPADFTIDGHAPVRELWYRASLAWREMLNHRQLRSCGLVVAHNAVNQALLCTALGLPPVFFRRFAQSNAAFTVLDFEYGGALSGQRLAAPPRVRVERMNQFPDRPLNPNKMGKSVPTRMVLVSGEATSPAVQASLNLLADSGGTSPPLIALGSAAQQAADVQTALEASLATPGDGRTVVAVASPEACQQLLGACLGTGDAVAAPQPGLGQGVVGVGGLFHMSDGGITIVSWPQGQRDLARGTVLCTNYQLPAAC